MNSDGGRYRHSRGSGELIQDPRQEVRYVLPIPVEIQHQVNASGLVRNISASGVWIDESGYLPPIGTTILVAIPGGGPPGLELLAEVVRYTTNTGFAARFVSLNPRSEKALRSVLEALHETVAEPDDDRTLAEWSERLSSSIGADLRELFSSLAREEAISTLALLRRSITEGRLKIVSCGEHDGDLG